MHQNFLLLFFSLFFQPSSSSINHSFAKITNNNLFFRDSLYQKEMPFRPEPPPTTLYLTSDEWKDILITTIKLGITGAISGFITYKIMEKLNEAMNDPKGKKSDKKVSEQVLYENGLLKPGQVLTTHECRFVSSIIKRGLKYPFVKNNDNDAHIEGFESIGGLHQEIEQLKKGIMEPLEKQKLVKKSLKKYDNSELESAMQYYKASSGVLLYGPPGTGKTALIRSISVELDIPFMHVQISDLLDKWLGESNKLVTSIFSLANKISPCIIFIDEIDSLLGIRRKNDHEVSTQIKTQFMSLWDGLSKPENEVILVAATNRPHMLDPAVNRRFSMKIQIKMPNGDQLADILKAKLRKCDTSAITDQEWRQMGMLCFHYKMTGSDIQECCLRVSRKRIDNYVKNGNGQIEKLKVDMLREVIGQVGQQKVNFVDDRDVYSQMFDV